MFKRKPKRSDKGRRPPSNAPTDAATVRFVDYTAESRDDWSSFVEQCDEAGVHHIPDFVEGSLLESGYAEISFSIRDDTGMVGICVLRSQVQLFGRILSGPGLAMLQEYKTSRILTSVRDELRRRAKMVGCCAIRFQIDPCAPAIWRQRFADSYLARFDCSLGVRGDDVDYESGYYIISDLHRAESEILRSFTKGNRAAVKRCRQQSVAVTMVSARTFTPEYWTDFELMLKAAGARNGFAILTKRQLAFLREQARQGRVIIFNSYKDGCIIASALFLYYKNALFYYAAGCIDDALHLGVMVHLHFEAMIQAKRLNASVYCVGPRYTNTTNLKMRDIGVFKQRLGNEYWDILSGELILDRRMYYLQILIPRVLVARHLIPGLKSLALFIRRSLKRLISTAQEQK